MEEGGGWVRGDLPAGGCDFDDFAVGVVEIEKNGVGLVRITSRGDAPMDGKARPARKGAGFEGTNGLAKRIVGGRLGMLPIKGVDEPVAETGREDGANLVATGAEGKADEGLAGGGGERGGGGGVVEEEFDLGMHLICPSSNRWKETKSRWRGISGWERWRNVSGFDVNEKRFL